MKIFVDSANLTDIEEALRRGFVSGITTNPSIISKEEKGDFVDHIRKIINVVRKYNYDIPLSVEVLTTDPDEMVQQAKDFVRQFGNYDKITIKVPIGWNELGVIRRLRDEQIKVNCTACMSFNQAIMAANAGANFVSIFYGRIRDMGYDASSIVRKVHQVFKEWDCASQIIVGSIRHIYDINEAIEAGADIVTVPPKFFEQLTSHPKTDEVVNHFLTDFKNWLK